MRAREAKCPALAREKSRRAAGVKGKALQGQAQHLAGEVGHGVLGQDKEPAVVGHQAQATVAL